MEHALRSKYVLGTIFPEDPGGKIRTWNWKLAGQAASNSKYDFFNTCLPPQDTRTWTRELVFGAPRCSLSVLLGATTSRTWACDGAGGSEKKKNVLMRRRRLLCLLTTYSYGLTVYLILEPITFAIFQLGHPFEEFSIASPRIPSDPVNKTRQTHARNTIPRTAQCGSRRFPLGSRQDPVA